LKVSMPDQVVQSSEIESVAREVGFDLCGFARPEPIPAEVLGNWLEAGFHADMDWMAERTAERLDVQTLFPPARTVVALACNYYWWEPSVEESPISRYARGRDYHATLKDRTRNFRRLLKERWPDIKTYSSIDSGPVMERIWAVRAGLGYIGRNGCLITPQYGSWVFLGTMILDLEVDRYASEQLPDSCGDCTLCVDSCPTDAFTSERMVDARRCLSYQTIENEGDVPAALRHTFENLVFGCDICQQVCPLNQAPLPSGYRFAPRAVASLGVRELAALAPEQFKELTQGTPLVRAGYDGLRRNSAYALGAMRDAGSRSLLERLAQDPSPKVAEAARWALAQISGA
jgi:epoxyqueuosine reductase